MNKALKWFLFCLIIFVSVIDIDQNVNSINHRGTNLFAIKLINLGTAIVFVILVITFIVPKLKRQKK